MHLPTSTVLTTLLAVSVCTAIQDANPVARFRAVERGTLTLSGAQPQGTSNGHGGKRDISKSTAVEAASVTSSGSKSAETSNGRGGSKADGTTDSARNNVLLPLPGLDARSGETSLLPLPNAGLQVCWLRDFTAQDSLD